VLDQYQQMGPSATCASLPRYGIIRLRIHQKGSAPVITASSHPLNPPMKRKSMKGGKMSKLRNLPLKVEEELESDQYNDDKDDEKNDMNGTNREDSIPNKEIRDLFLRQRSYFAILPVLK
jgi:hypothetical protein